ncbi:MULTISPECIES: DUF4879 domain-containing protein [unclassified Marinomonas]|uniref:DUF4879 domain-containing protein n=1 Tax=unclassified Marinomonas TaxID=196814 RepID=UPI000A50065D|nr:MULTISPECIES: DUF4879 domain-containing protein [unclassified Marinomonas]
MKKQLISLALITAGMTGNAIAADIEAGVVKRIADQSKMAPKGIAPLDLSNISIDTGAKTLSSFAPATGITYFEIGHIGSTNYGGWEAVSSYQSSTVNDHGGTELYAYVWQFGYGNISSATFNGVSKTPEQSQYRCGTDLHVCATGETVTGWAYLYNLSGQESGTFNVSANSVASPFGYWSDSIYIQ